MKRGQEERLRRLEYEYAAEQEAQREIELRWLTEDEIKRGVKPGLYDLDSRRSVRLIAYAFASRESEKQDPDTHDADAETDLNQKDA
jgi:hypothetical protein